MKFLGNQQLIAERYGIITAMEDHVYSPLSFVLGSEILQYIVIERR